MLGIVVVHRKMCSLSRMWLLVVMVMERERESCWLWMHTRINSISSNFSPSSLMVRKRQQSNIITIQHATTKSAILSTQQQQICLAKLTRQGQQVERTTIWMSATREAYQFDILYWFHWCKCYLFHSNDNNLTLVQHQTHALILNAVDPNIKMLAGSVYQCVLLNSMRCLRKLTFYDGIKIWSIVIFCPISCGWPNKFNVKRGIVDCEV
jgi:hypothetical protein